MYMEATTEIHPDNGEKEVGLPTENLKNGKKEEGEKLMNKANEKTIHDEIADILGKIKKQESENAKKFEEERKEKEEKRKKSEFMKAKIAEELDKIRRLEEMQHATIRQQEQKRADDKIKLLMKEKEEYTKREEEKIKDKKKKEELEKKQKIKSMNDLKREKEKVAAKKAEEEMKSKIAQGEENLKKIGEDEKKRQKIVEEEKKRLWAEEQSKERKRMEEERKAKLEEDRRVTAEIIAKRKAEEEEMTRLKKEAEEEKSREAELAKKMYLEEKKKAILNTFEMQNTKNNLEIHRPKRKSVNLPFAQKFEEIALNTKKEQKEQQVLEDKKRSKKSWRKSKDLLRRSKQLLHKASKESLRKSKTLCSKGSNNSLKKSSTEHSLNCSISNLKKSISGNNLNKSKQNIFSREKNASNKNLQQNHTNIKHANKKEMQNFLISQVLFDGKEDVKTSRVFIKPQECMILEDVNEDQEIIKQNELGKKKHEEHKKREYELKKQIQEELRKVMEVEEEQKMKNQDAKFEMYKKDMEKYLDFVCVEKKDTKTKKKKPKEKTEKKLLLNIGSIKNQFEKESDKNNVSPLVKSAPPQVQKLNPIKLFTDRTDETKMRKKKEYVPVIIDKAAFERTVGRFEKENKEEEERIKHEARMKKRKEEMAAEKQRIIEEKKKHLQEEENKRYLEEKRKEEEETKFLEGNQKENVATHLYTEKNAEMETLTSAEKVAPSEPEPDIFEKIQRELQKIKQEEEEQSKKIAKENKRRQLMKQIEEEISKIKGDAGNEKKEDTFDETPAWIQQIMRSTENSKHKKTPKVTKIIVKEEPSICEDNSNYETPKWISIFQERSKKLEMQTKATDSHVVENNSSIEISNNDLISKTSQFYNKNSSTDINSKESIPSKNKEVKNVKIKTVDTINKNKVEEAKLQIQKKEKEEKVEPTRRSKPQKVAERVRKVKSLLLDSKQRDEENTQPTTVSKHKASQMKNKFENQLNDQTSELKVVQKKQRKIKAKMCPESLGEETGPSKQNKSDKQWKWKEKSLSELHNYMNENKEYLPKSLAEKTNKTLPLHNPTEQLASDSITDTNDMQDFSNYLCNVHTFLNAQDKDETETVFKDTISAYLDLIEDKPTQKTETVDIKHEIALPSKTSVVKTLFEGGNNSMKNIPEKEKVVGRVDSSFLSKEKNIINPTKNTLITNDGIKSIRNKYEDLGKNTSAMNDLYSIKRKLVPSKPDIDTMAWKKEQVQHQWKYKQQGIEELQNFLNENRHKIEPLEESKTTQMIATLPIIPKIDFKKKNEEDDRRMEEFENFMEEIHDYLESDTTNDEESEFKWGIHSYVDLIENDENKVHIRYENKKKDLIPYEKMPKTSEIRAKLEETATSSNVKEFQTGPIGRVDVSFLQDCDSVSSKSESKGDTVSQEVASKLRSQYENINKEETENKERIVVKKKLIQLPEKQTVNGLIINKNGQEWKYKQKSLAEMQAFIHKNKDIAPIELLPDGDGAGPSYSSILLQKSNELKSKIVDKDKEFSDFINELESFTDGPSKNEAEHSFKNGIKDYLSLIDPEGSNKSESNLPKLGSVKKIANIKSRLYTNEDLPREEKKSSALIGKVSHFFKKSTKEKCDSTVVKENITSLLEPGKAKVISKKYEEKPKLLRSVSECDLQRKKIPRRFNFDQFKDKEIIIDKKPSSLTPKIFREKEKEIIQGLNNTTQVDKKVKKPESLAKCKNEWESITDPEEKKNAILAKYGCKPVRKIEDTEQDMEDILNYEHNEDISKYEEDLKERYGLCDSSSRESSPEPVQNKKSSFSSLLNILTTMKKATASKNFNESQLKVKDFGEEKGVRSSRSVADLSDINVSCTDIRHLYENGKTLNTPKESRQQHVDIDNEIQGSENIFDRKEHLENLYKSSSRVSTEGSSSFVREETARSKSVADIRTLLEDGAVNEETIRQYIDQRSETSKEGKKTKLFGKVQQMFESGNKLRRKDLDESSGDEEPDAKQTVKSELEEIKNKSKRFSLEKGKRSDQTPGCSLRRTNSCLGVTGERVLEDLDKEVIKEVSVTNKMVKAMFEQAAPKYTFGGSGSNLSLNGSKEDVSKSKPVMRPSAKPKEDRKWVLDSINKYFDVIVEEDEEDGVACDDFSDEASEYDYESSEYCSDSDVDDIIDEQPVTKETQESFQSTFKMRGMLNSIVSNISSSVGNLAKRDLMNNLKQNLGSRISLKTSNAELDNL